ncbi:hypothetical protein KKF34_15260 [Myxococcota bacterium]|nr:hypothetical protein [Myxococcota bacterium]MBU1498236.1 hypothetical protein [Myxococcota bacterium]
MAPIPALTNRAEKLSPVWPQADDPQIQGRVRIHGWRHSRLCDYPGAHQGSLMPSLMCVSHVVALFPCLF